MGQPKIGFCGGEASNRGELLQPFRYIFPLRSRYSFTGAGVLGEKFPVAGHAAIYLRLSKPIFSGLVVVSFGKTLPVKRFFIRLLLPTLFTAAASFSGCNREGCTRPEERLWETRSARVVRLRQDRFGRCFGEQRLFRCSRGSAKHSAKAATSASTTQRQRYPPVGLQI